MHHLPFPIGLHLILTPGASCALIPDDRCAAIHEAILLAAHRADCAFKAAHVEADHVHVLVIAVDEQHAASFFDELVEHTTSAARNGSQYEAFAWNDRVHLTLLLPWHIEVFASFVRDQAHYHETHTLEQELDEVFLPPMRVMP